MSKARTASTKIPTDRREQILAHAPSMFAERGFEATTIRDLAKELDLKSASIYHFFEDKEQLLLRPGDLGGRAAHGRREAARGGGDLLRAQVAVLVVNHVVMHALRPAETTLETRSS